jgi:hypothetical protein
MFRFAHFGDVELAIRAHVVDEYCHLNSVEYFWFSPCVEPATLTFFMANKALANFNVANDISWRYLGDSVYQGAGLSASTASEQIKAICDDRNSGLSRELRRVLRLETFK